MELGLVLFFRALMYFTKFYFTLLAFRVILFWFPNIPMYRQPWNALFRITDPYLRVFRDAIPPMFGFDISAVFAFMILQIIIDLAPRLYAIIS